jgi:DNA-binding GntR family transcriptional regulator
MRLSGRERAYDFLKKDVLTDPDMQGQFINEQSLADRIGVSRTPIREALLMLAAEELVQLVPKRGAYIAPMSGRELAELIELRGMIERFAAQRSLTSDTLDEMRDALAAQHLLRSPRQAKEFIELDTRFHTALVRATGNQMLTRMYEGLHDRQVRAGLMALFQAPGRQDSVLAEHKAIVDALAAGNAESVAQAIDSHLEGTLKILLTS